MLKKIIVASIFSATILSGQAIANEEQKHATELFYFFNKSDLKEHCSTLISGRNSNFHKEVLKVRNHCILETFKFIDTNYNATIFKINQKQIEPICKKIEKESHAITFVYDSNTNYVYDNCINNIVNDFELRAEIVNISRDEILNNLMEEK